jgi:AraC-like DNA-binding protein
MELQTRPARRELRRFVRVYAQREVSPTGAVIIQSLPARLEQTLEFQFGPQFRFLLPSGEQRVTTAVMVVGAQTQWGVLSVPPGVMSFGVFFQPTGFSRLFGIPMAELARSAHDGNAIITRVLNSLRNEMAESNSFSQRVRIIEEFLLQQASRISPSNPIEVAAARIFAAKGAVRVAEIALQHGLGVRQFERRFLECTGLAPKVYARIARFQTALDAKIYSPVRPWLEIAHGLGYHDQMHMVRDFHDLAGNTPGKIFSSIGDARPPAIEASENTFC